MVPQLDRGAYRLQTTLVLLLEAGEDEDCGEEEGIKLV